jgi:hypothetical protein
MTPSPPPDRHAIGAIGAFVEGWRRVWRAPAVWMGVCAATLAGLLAASGVDLDVGPRTTLLGVAASFFGLLPQFVDPVTVAAASVHRGGLTVPAEAAIGVYVAAWTFVWGGALDRLARNRPVGTPAFFAACGVYFGRFVRLGVPVGLAYLAAIYWTQAYPWLFYLLLVVVSVFADFARARAVVEDRRSMLGAIVASGRFVRRRPLDVVALYVFYLGALLAFASILAVALPRLNGYLWPIIVIWVPFVWLRLALGASEIALFQSALAHAEYTAAPLPIWPDSPAAEAIDNLVRQRTEDKVQKA